LQQLHESIELQAPTGGLHRAVGYQSKPPFYAENLLNVRAYDVFEGRGRIGSRPGLIKPYSQNVSVDGLVTQEFTVDFAASADNHIGGDISPIDSNRGSATSLFVGRESVVQLPGYAPHRTLLHFNMNILPASATLTAATLQLYQFSHINGTPEARIYRITQSAWTELGSNWDKYDGVTGWTTDGGDFDLTTPAPISWFIQATNGSFGINVLGHAQDAYTNRSKQLHMLLKLLDDLVVDNEVGYYYSRDYTTVPSRQPKLTVTYEVSV
jgi:hypothetical protein